MYGSRTRGLDGHTYDSGEEHAVAQALGQLQREQLVAGYMTHALLCGFNLDFLVQLGPASTGNGRLIALEYDGLGLNRTKKTSTRMRWAPSLWSCLQGIDGSGKQMVLQ